MHATPTTSAKTEIPAMRPATFILCLLRRLRGHG
jgi:hypothetical protein